MSVAFRALGVRGSIDIPEVAKSSSTDLANPFRRIVGVLGPNDGDAKVGGRKKKPAHCVGAEWASVRRVTFDEQVGPNRRSAQAAELNPQTAPDQREVQVHRGLPLDQGDALNRVVADREALTPHAYAEQREPVRHTAAPLVRIGNDLHFSSVTVERRMSVTQA